MTDAERATDSAYRRAWYQRHKADNSPVYQRMLERGRRYRRTHLQERRVWWRAQREGNTPTYQHLLDHSRARTRGLKLEEYQAQPRVQLVCCGVWAAVTQLPHVCPACGRRYLEAPP